MAVGDVSACGFHNVPWEHRWEHGTLIPGTPDTPDPHNHADSA